MHLKVMVVFQGGTNLPEDRFVNTLHFDATLSSLSDAPGVYDSYISAFWNAPVGDNLGKAMPAFVSRTVQLRYYDMAQAEPRVPVLSTFTIGTPISATALPEECAVVGTFYGQPPITPSRRGRIYLGPLSGYAQTNSTTTTPVRVIAAYRTLVTTGMKAWADAPIGWCVYSAKNDQLVSVEGGYCDDAFDTMRKRGPKTTARTSWTATIV